jgi:hypothetical protein
VTSRFRRPEARKRAPTGACRPRCRSHADRISDGRAGLAGLSASAFTRKQQSLVRRWYQEAAAITEELSTALTFARRKPSERKRSALQPRVTTRERTDRSPLNRLKRQLMTAPPIDPANGMPLLTVLR